MIVTPVNWYQAPGPLKAMMDRLVCADGGNPDPTTTHGKNADEAKALELAGWPYPRHLAGRLFSAVVHADAAGAAGPRGHRLGWGGGMDTNPPAGAAGLCRYIGPFSSPGAAPTT